MTQTTAATARAQAEALAEAREQVCLELARQVAELPMAGHEVWVVQMEGSLYADNVVDVLGLCRPTPMNDDEADRIDATAQAVRRTLSRSKNLHGMDYLVLGKPGTGAEVVPCVRSA
tara:strand:+ start:156 stop:506 length:351 start_codon:yes stop_codon:yes gene_type:complete